jgi:oxygen-independent coproporphyrinogen III oxidase
MENWRDSRWFETQIDLDRLVLSGIIRPSFEYEKAHTFPVSQPEGMEWKNPYGPDQLFKELASKPQSFRFYVHVPFCNYKCAYCFYDTYQGEGLRYEYLQTINEELNEAAKKITGRDRLPDVLAPEERVPLRDLYIGGGTPTALSVPELKYLLEAITRVAQPQDENTFVATCECTPDTLAAPDGREKIALLLKYGVNRFSLGVQTCSNETLDSVCRGHGGLENARAAVDAIHDICRDADLGRPNLNVDLIYGFPGQTISDWEEDLGQFDESFAGCMPQSVTFYYMRYHPNSRLGKVTPDAHRVPWSDLVEMRRSYCRFARDKWGYQMCRPHYWREKEGEAVKYQGAPCLDYDNEGAQIGFGPSAYSHIGLSVGRNKTVLKDWIEAVQSNRFGTDKVRELTLADQQTRYVIRRLYRDPAGFIDRQQFETTFPSAKLSRVFENQEKAFKQLEMAGCLVVRVTDAGWQLREAGGLVDEEVMYFLYPNQYRTSCTFSRGLGTASLDLNNRVTVLLREFVREATDQSEQTKSKFVDCEPGSEAEVNLMRELFRSAFFALRNASWSSESRQEEELPSSWMSAPLSLGQLLPGLSLERGQEDRVAFDVLGPPHFGSISIHKPNRPDIVAHKITFSNHRDPFGGRGIARLPSNICSDCAIDEDRDFADLHQQVRKWISTLCNQIVEYDRTTDELHLVGRGKIVSRSTSEVLREALQDEVQRSPKLLTTLFSHHNGTVIVEADDQKLFQHLITSALKTRQSTALAEVDAEVPLVLIRRRRSGRPTVDFARREETGGVPVRNIIVLDGHGWEKILLQYVKRASMCRMRVDGSLEKCSTCVSESCLVFPEADSNKAVHELLQCLMEYVKEFCGREKVNWCHVDAVEFVFPFLYLGVAVVTCVHRRSLSGRRGSLSLSLATNPLPPVAGYLEEPRTEETNSRIEITPRLEALCRWAGTIAVGIDRFAEGIMAQLIAADLDYAANLRGQGVGRFNQATVSGHEAGAQLFFALNALSIPKEHISPYVHELLIGSLEYASLYLSIHEAKVPTAYLPWYKSTSGHTISKCVSSWVQHNLVRAWRLAVAREAYNLNNPTLMSAATAQIFSTLLGLDAASGQKVESPSLPDSLQNSIDRKSWISPDWLFSPPSDNYTSPGELATFPFSLTRWFLAAASNALRWSGPGTAQIRTGPMLLKHWAENFEGFHKIAVVCEPILDGKASRIAVYNGYDDSVENIEDLSKMGTGRVISRLTEELRGRSLGLRRATNVDLAKYLPGEMLGFVADIEFDFPLLIVSRNGD